MCGIAGWVNYQGKSLMHQTSLMHHMADRVAHRGPDEAGEYWGEQACLVHRRLVVVDPAGGKQPMTARWRGQEGTIVYNGELYNTDEVRRELCQLGQEFASYSDTEVVLKAFLEWGSASLSRLNGIFAFAVWQPQQQTLFLARDRLGVKPLFYAHSREGLIFASEIKAILAHGAVQPVVDGQGLLELFMLGPARTPGTTPYRDIHELKPGHFLVHRLPGTQIQRYWQLPLRQHGDDQATTEVTLRELLADGVSRQLVSDVLVATLLSGGLDSSALTSLATRQLTAPEPLVTYSVEYRQQAQYFQATAYQPDSDELWSERVSSLLGTQHRRVVLDTPQLLAALPLAMRANDYPGMTDIDASLLLFCQHIKAQHTVALSGEAADEIFGGYPWFRLPQSGRESGFPWSRHPSLRSSLLAPQLRQRLEPLGYYHERYGQALAEVPELRDLPEAERQLREISYLSLTRFMPTLLDRKDRMSMAAGLEVRVPFTDHRLVEYAWNIPWSLQRTGAREKGLLRNALQGLLPQEVLWRPKSPYPKTHHPDYLAATRRWLLAVLDDPHSPLLPLLDVARVRQLAENPRELSSTPWFGQLMGSAQLFAYLALTDQWLREYGVQLAL